MTETEFRAKISDWSQIFASVLVEYPGWKKKANFYFYPQDILPRKTQSHEFGIPKKTFK